MSISSWRRWVDEKSPERRLAKFTHKVPWELSGGIYEEEKVSE
jgi:hypothetical protein